jgi:hypothetical protein
MTTRKDFTAVAEIIAAERSTAFGDNDSGNALDRITDSLADYFETSNPAFDRNRFRKAAGWGEGSK